MIFTSISLENFGILKKFSKEFVNKILVISGDNGSGKSSLLKAIMLAVFDEYDGTLEDYVNWESDFFKVVVGFTHRGVQYENTVIYDGSTDRTLRFGDKVLKGEEAKKKIKELFDGDLLKAAMLAVEQQIDVVATKPAERRDYLKRIYVLEFKHQISVPEDESKEHELELAKRTAIRTEIENRQYSVPERLSFPFTEIEYELNKTNLELARKTLPDIEGQLRVYQQAKSDVDTLTQQFDQLDIQIASSTKEVSQINDLLADLPERKQALLEELKTKRENQLQANTKELEDLTARLDSIENERKNIFLERLPLFNNDDYTANFAGALYKKIEIKRIAKRQGCLSYLRSKYKYS
jgi:DNA repair exonuclease SbcCD ATPase subunit